MRSVRKIKTAADSRYRRHLRVRKKVEGTPERPRLVVFRSSKHIYAQLVDDQRGVTIAGAADTSEGVQVEGKGKVARSFAVGKLIATLPLPSTCTPSDASAPAIVTPRWSSTSWA